MATNFAKSQDRADKLRSEGNACYVERHFFEALVNYNKSLCSAENGSEAMGMAYANRSAVYFELKLYDKSLANIDRARTSGYPNRKLRTLDARTRKCLEKITTGCEGDAVNNPYDFIKLSYEFNPKISNVANCLELKTNEKFGRHIVTNQELKVGDIVAMEQPYFKIIKCDSRYDCCEDTNAFQRCAFCLRSNLLELIPCETCSCSTYTKSVGN